MTEHVLIEKSGGVLTLSGANTYARETRVEGGTGGSMYGASVL